MNVLLFSRFWKRFLLCLLLFCAFWNLKEVACGAPEIPKAETSPDRAFLESLLNRGLFRLAELHCRERLNAQTISPMARAELTLELIRVLQERSLCAPAPEKKELDAKSQSIYEDFQKANPDCPWLLPVQFQYAVGIFAQAKRLEMEARFALEPETRMEEAREVLRDAIRRFLEIDAQREALVLALAQKGSPGNAPGTSRKNSKTAKDSTKNSSRNSGKNGTPSESAESSRFSEDGLSLWELESLKSSVQFQLLLAYELQALTYPPDSLDRLNALKEAQTQAGKLTLVPSSSTFYWNARLAEIRCFRLQNDFESAQKRIDFLEKQPETMPENVRLELLAEKIRLALAAQQTEQALEIVKTELHANILGTNGELDCAILELWLAQWQDAMKKNASNAPGSSAAANLSENEIAQKLRDESLGILETIRAKSSPWWVRRAEILFNGKLKNSGETRNLSFLKLAAENACTNHDADAALACERLWRAACDQSDPETALHAAQMAAAFLYQNDRKAESADWFRRIAVTFPQHADALKNHALAISVLAEELASNLQSSKNSSAEKPSGVERTPELTPELNASLDRYQALLLEHFQLFGKTDPDVLGNLRKLQTISRIRGNLAEWVDVSMLLTASTPTDDPSRTETESACFDAWRHYLASLEKKALKRPQNDSGPDSANSSADPDSADPDSANSSADFPETNSSLEYQKALFNAIRWSETLPESETRALGSFFLFCALDRLNAQLKTPTSAPGSQASSANLQKRILQAEGQLFKGMKPFQETFPPEVRDEIEQIGMKAMLAGGNHQDAFPLYEKHAAKFPNRLEVQLTWGRLLAEMTFEKNQTDHLIETLEQWRSIEKHVKEQSPEWFEAKYWVIRSLFAMGESPYARRLLRTLRTLHPDLGGDLWKKKFEELEELPENQPKK